MFKNHSQLILFLIGFIYCGVYIPIVRAQLKETDCYFNSVYVSQEYAYSTSLSNVRECFAKIPLDPKVAQENLSVAESVLDGYSFEYLIKNSAASGSSYDLKIDARLALKNMRTKSYSSEYQFHSELTSLFNSFQDAHTRYFMPRPYRTSYLFFPLPITIRKKVNGDLSVVVTSSSSAYQSYYNTVTRISPDSFIDMTVSNINNVSSIAFLNDFMSIHPISKDSSPRLNSFLKERLFSINNIGFPQADGISVQFSNGKVQYFPYMMYMLSAKNGIESFRNQSARVATTTRSIHPDHVISMDPSEIHIPKPEETIPSPSRDVRATTSSVVCNHYENTTILQIKTFNPDTITGFKAAIIDCVKVAGDRNIPQLLIDLQGNGGGRVCLAITLLNYLIGEFDFLQNIDEPREFKQHEMLSKLYPSTTNSIFLDSNTKSRKSLSFLTSNGIYKDFGGNGAYYSEQFTIDCRSSSENDAVFTSKPSYYFPKIIAVTDGLCGSACSLFATKLKLYNKAKLYNVGGGSNGKSETFETSSFCGGSVLDYMNIIQLRSDTTLPKLTLTNSQFTFNVHHVYIKNVSLPREFLKLEGDGVLPTWNFTNIENIMNLLQPVFTEMEVLNEPSYTDLIIALSVTIPLTIFMLVFVIGTFIVVLWIRKRSTHRKRSVKSTLDEPLNSSNYSQL